MASSGKPPRRARAPDAAPAQSDAGALDVALDAALAVLDEELPGVTIAVAVSGGRDSIALLHALATRGRAHIALSIDHRLHDESGAWVDCARNCAATLGVTLQAERVEVTGVERRGLEEAARVARYACLAQLCRESGANVLALAHHLDDVAETVLLQALRGSGLAGIAAMPALAADASETATDLSPPAGGVPVKLWRWRPLLEVPRGAIDCYVAAHGLEYADDPSNSDARYVRNALRLQVLPAIARHFPAYRQTLARLAGHAAEAATLLADVARSDLEAAAETDPVLGDTIRLSRWLELPPARQAQVLRAWLARHGLRAPSQARLQEMQRQLGRAAPDAALLLTHEGRHVRRYRDWIVVEAPSAATATESVAEVTINWQGETIIEVPELGGRLLVEAEQGEGAWGVARATLAATALVLRARRGRERLQLNQDGPSRSLKNVFQEHGVPNWQRARLPLAYLGDRLLWVAGIGFDTRMARRSGERLGLRWEYHQEAKYFI